MWISAYRLHQDVLLTMWSSENTIHQVKIQAKLSSHFLCVLRNTTIIRLKFKKGLWLKKKFKTLIYSTSGLNTYCVCPELVTLMQHSTNTLQFSRPIKKYSYCQQVLLLYENEMKKKKMKTGLRHKLPCLTLTELSCVVLYLGHLLSRHCGSALPASVDTSDSFAYVRFVSDSSGNRAGFSLSFQSSVEGKIIFKEIIWTGLFVYCRSKNYHTFTVHDIYTVSKIKTNSCRAFQRQVIQCFTQEKKKGHWLGCYSFYSTHLK